MSDPTERPTIDGAEVDPSINPDEPPNLIHHQIADLIAAGQTARADALLLDFTGDQGAQSAEEVFSAALIAQQLKHKVSSRLEPGSLPQAYKREGDDEDARLPWDALYVQAIDLTDDPQLRAEIHLARAHAGRQLFSTLQGLDSAVEAAEQAARPDILAEVLTIKAMIELDDLRCDDAIATAEDMKELASSPTLPPRIRAGLLNNAQQIIDTEGLRKMPLPSGVIFVKEKADGTSTERYVTTPPTELGSFTIGSKHGLVGVEAEIDVASGLLSAVSFADGTITDKISKRDATPPDIIEIPVIGDVGGDLARLAQLALVLEAHGEELTPEAQTLLEYDRLKIVSRLAEIGLAQKPNDLEVSDLALEVEQILSFHSASEKEKSLIESLGEASRSGRMPKHTPEDIAEYSLDARVLSLILPPHLSKGVMTLASVQQDSVEQSQSSTYPAYLELMAIGKESRAIPPFTDTGMYVISGLSGNRNLGGQLARIIELTRGLDADEQFTVTRLPFDEIFIDPDSFANAVLGRRSAEELAALKAEMHEPSDPEEMHSIENPEIRLQRGAASFDPVSLRLAADAVGGLVMPNIATVKDPVWTALTEIIREGNRVTAKIDTGHMTWPGDLNAKQGEFTAYTGELLQNVTLNGPFGVAKVDGWVVTNAPMVLSDGTEVRVWFAETQAPDVLELRRYSLAQTAYKLSQAFSGEKRDLFDLEVPAMQVKYSSELPELLALNPAIEKVEQDINIALDYTGARAAAKSTVTLRGAASARKKLIIGHRGPVMVWWTSGLSNVPFAPTLTTSEAWLQPGQKPQINFD